MMKVSLLQMNIIPGNLIANRENAAQLINKAALQHPDTVVLPEMWTTAYQLEGISSICDKYGEPTNDMIGAIAAEKKINIVAGSYASLEEEQVFNTAYIF
ncbi:MAG: carbon-nitrogen hydrolase, partial [Clostridia bacterium]|nr:carbon-nitrogen hydrolase [Clostridia bacterium]